MAVDGRGGGETQGLADLSHRWGIAPLGDGVGDELQGLALAVGKALDHGCSSWLRTDVRHRLVERWGRNQEHVFDESLAYEHAFALH